MELASQSLLNFFQSLPIGERQRRLGKLNRDEQAHLGYVWELYARPNQLPPPGDWRVWLVLAGRGFGKTRMGAEWIRKRAESGRFGRFALIGQTAADVRDVMVEGESGILAISPPAFCPEYEPSKRRLTWPNGAIATTYSGDSPDQLRGPQHDSAWADEPAKWQYGQESWDNMEMGLRIGPKPQVVATTTPRPIRLIKELLTDPATVVTRGATYENLPNLAPSFAQRILARYEGTRLGRQELHAEILEDNPGALWQRGLIEDSRVIKHPPLVRIVIAVDPEATSGEDSAETGIIAAGVDENGHGYILEDNSLRGTPKEWADQAVAAYYRMMADRIIGEVNNGGEMVGYTISTSDPNVAYQAIHASRSKQARAEPVAALYEQGRVHHVGTFPDLEDQLCAWVPGSGPSPDRLDALVWALTELIIDTGAASVSAVEMPW